MHDFVILKKFQNSKDLIILGHPTHADPPLTPCIKASKGHFYEG
jgi:hypothetical protein